MITNPPQPLGQLRDLLVRGDAEFWPELARRARAATSFDELLGLATMRKRGLARGHSPGREGAPQRIAVIGAYTTYPLRELLELLLWANGVDATLWTGDYDNYVSEILDEASALYAALPQIIVVIPSVARCRYDGALTDDRSMPEQQVRTHVEHLLGLCATCRERTQGEIILCNYPLPGDFDLGAFRTRTLGSDWSFRKAVNLELGLRAPAFVHVCDIEFLCARRGALACRDARRWFESKQPGSPDLLVDMAGEVAHLARSLRSAPKKVLALDLDNTLWGGVIGDDGLDGIELGTTSPRGEAFRAFQSYVASLKNRGVLLAVCSKNDHARAAEVFEKHPEMVLRMSDFAAFAANWNAKSDNLHAIAAELNLGLDSFVFVDDNPAEVEIVRQFAPSVETILLGSDPADYVSQLADCRWFEPRSITAEDLERTNQYRAEGERRELLASVTDMNAYLDSLDMVGIVKPFCGADVVRITQLVNKSNQFNLTTRRRTEGAIAAMLGDGPTRGFTIRLSDRFGDHGLIAVVICEKTGTTLEIDTWVMSCRVLKRQVEEETVNAIMRLARALGAERVRGHYLPTPKNAMVRDLFPRMGFSPTDTLPDHFTFDIDSTSYLPKSTKICIRVKNEDG
jgi:FkbH-like protein